jgi:Fe-S oxidoreductase
MRVERGNIKPVRHGVKDEELDDLESFGVKKAGRLSPGSTSSIFTPAPTAAAARTTARPTPSAAPCPRASSPSRAATDVQKLPPLSLRHAPFLKSEELIGTIYEEDEIWSCTTCGACEQECPLGIEYIDKIVDLRRGMVDEGMVPQSLQKPLRRWKNAATPGAKWKRNAPTGPRTKPEGVPSRSGQGPDGRNPVFCRQHHLLRRPDAGDRPGVGHGPVTGRVDFGILGKLEKDSGHEIRRFGEEMLFQDLKEMNTEAILDSGVKRIVTADPMPTMP